MQRITTSRLILERPATRLAERIWRWEADDEIAFMSGSDEELPTPEDIAEALAAWTRPDRQDLHVFSILLKDSEDPIGYLQVANIDPQRQGCDLGILIGEKPYWGRGLGQEALRAAISYCFDDLALNRIGAEIYAINPRSIRLFEACGFRREGTVRDEVVKEIDGERRFVDGYRYSLLRREWSDPKSEMSSSSACASNEALVMDLWRYFNEKEWERSKQLFHEDFIAEWPQSRERFRGCDNFVGMNEAYPGSFEIVVKRISSMGPRVISEVQITPAAGQALFAISFFDVLDGKLHRAIEYWADCYEAQDWRSHWVEL